MIRLGARLAVVAVCAVVAACGDVEPPAPTVTFGPPTGVALYGRNALPQEVWLAVAADVDLTQNVGFNGRDLGVACWTAPINAPVVLLDGSPARGASAVQTIGRVEAGHPMWVDIAANGAVTSGVGVPAWWPPGGGPACS